MTAASILVVDDNPTNLKLASDVLEFAGYRVLKAADADEALAVVKGSPPDLILMDLALPGMDGLTLTKLLKADEATKHIRIVAMTAFAMKGDDLKAIEAGCNGYITKPIDTRTLPAQVADYLEAHESTAQRVLIVDDVETNRKLLRVILEGEGLKTFEAADGLEALVMLERQPVDAIISDILMPNMDGYRLCYEVRRSERFGALPFIFYTNTYTSATDEKLALELGADRFLARPSSAREVFAALHEVTSPSRPAPRAFEPPFELELMKSYSERLVAKLEERNAELQQRTKELEQELVNRKRMEEALRKSEAWLRGVFESPMIGTLLWDATGLISDANDAFLEIVGYTRDDLAAGRVDWAALAPPEYSALDEKALDEMARTGRCTTFEKEYIRKDGSRVPVLIGGATLEGARDHGVAFALDITERKMAEEDRQKFVSLADSSHEFISMSDRDFKPFYVNAAGMRLVGLPNLEAACQVKVQDFFFPEDQPFITHEFFPRVLCEGQGEVEIRFRHFKTGAPIWMLYNVFNIQDDRGDVIAWATLSRDITERKRAEEALQETELRLRTVLSNAPITIFATDGHGVFTLSEGKGLELVGLKPGENVGVSAFDLYGSMLFVENTGKVTAGKDVVRRVLAGETVTAVSELRRVYFENRIVPLQGTDGKVVGILGVATDITERKRAEDALRESEERHRTILRTAMDGFLRVDLQGRLLEVNEAYCRMSGYSEQELLAMSIPDLEVAETPADTAARVQRIVAQDEDRFESQHRRKDGSSFAVEVSAQYKSAEGGHMVTFLRDITERKQAEEALQQSELKYRRLHETMTDAFVLVDIAGHILECNRTYGDMLGYTEAELRQLAYQDVTPEKWHAFEARIIQEQILPQGFSGVYEKEYRRKDGTVFPVELRVSLIRDEAGQPAAMSAIVRDITERNRADEALRNSHEQLRALSAHLQSIREEERTMMAREIHDELGQALTGLKMDLSALQNGLNKKGAAQAERLIEKTVSMSKLIDTTIQTVQRIATELRPGILDDLGLVAAIEWQAQDFQSRTGIECRFTSGVEDLDLGRDRSTAAFRILQETLTNVARHAEATGVDVSLNHSDDSVVLEIRDNGSGISEANIGSSKSLGLLGMRERAHLLGGELKISGSPGKGTTVTVRIPIE